MGLVSRGLKFALRTAGAGSLVELALQSERASAERDRYLLERDIAIGERNGFIKQLAEAKRAMLEPWRPSDDPVRDLAGSINGATPQPSSVFFHAVDQAREQFRARWDGSMAQALLAVRLINLLTAKHEYLWGATATTARPVGFMLDPANQCHLGCPSCVNSFNTTAAAAFNKWPRALMSAATFDAFLAECGLYAFSGHFYNAHEPLLNKLTPAFVRKAADLRIQTFMSSNLSYQRIDAEAIVASGLTVLLCAIDGATQPAYERYRKGGHLAWVLANARAIAEAKRKLKSPTPMLRWQFLTFAHNVHEVPQAIELAREIGFDDFNLATPNSVKDDDPTVESVVYAGPDHDKSVTFKPPPAIEWTGDLDPRRAIIEAALSESAVERWRSEAKGKEPIYDDKTGHRCDWLHLGVIADALGRVVPCCNGDYKNQGRFIFTDVGSAGGNIMNSEAYRQARQVLTDPAAAARHDEPVICARCPGRPDPQIGLGAVGGYLTGIPSLATSDMAFLYEWSRHTPLLNRRAT